MMCPKCKQEDLEQLNPGIDTLQEDDEVSHPEDTFVAIDYNCSNCGNIVMFYDYDRTENSDGEDIHTTKRELKDLEEDPSLPDTYFLDH